MAVLWIPSLPIWATAIAAVLIWISVTDFVSFEIPEAGWILLLGAGLVFRFHAGDRALQIVADAVLWPLLVWMVVTLHARVRGRLGLGFGDVKLLAGIGAWVGMAGMVPVLLAASLSGILAIVVLAGLRRHSLSMAATNMIAFGPFLCLSCWAVLLQEGRI